MQMVGSAALFQALVENSSDAISLVDADGQVLYANTSTADVLGYEPAELVGRNGLDLVHPQDRDDSVRTLKQLGTEPRGPYRIQTRVRQKDGQWRWVESTASNLLNQPQVGAIVMNHRSIDQRQAADEQRQRVVDELTRSNAELQVFAYAVAHDLKEPLRTISTFTELLLRRSQAAAADPELAQIIVDGVRRMSTMLEGLLASATSKVNDPPPTVALEHAGAQAMLNLRAALDTTGATVAITSLPMVRANECDLVRLFQNLIGNALKYRSAAPVQVHITAEPFGAHALIRVRDNGIGIAKEHHLRVFDLFARLPSDDIPGTGIGLSVCKKIVEGLGGAIWVESEPGAGATFCFTVASCEA